MFPNLRLLFLVAQEINYPFSYSVNYEIKQRKKAWNLVIPSIIQQTQSFPNEFDESPLVLSSFVETSESNTKKFGDTTAVGGTGWFMDLFTNHCKTLFYWPETSALSCELLKLGCDWLSRTKTTVESTDKRIYCIYKGKDFPRMPKVPSFVLVPITVHR